jgi:hypothetical protein
MIPPGLIVVYATLYANGKWARKFHDACPIFPGTSCRRSCYEGKPRARIVHSCWLILLYTRKALVQIVSKRLMKR